MTKILQIKKFWLSDRPNLQFRRLQFISLVVTWRTPILHSPPSSLRPCVTNFFSLTLIETINELQKCKNWTKNGHSDSSSSCFLLLCWKSTSGQFHQQFMRAFFVRNCFARLFSSYVLALVKGFWQKKHFRKKNVRIKCWWNWPKNCLIF